MTFPSSNGTRQDSLATAWQRARDTAGSIKVRASTVRNAAQAGDIGTSAVLGLATFFADAKVNLLRSSTTTGIAVYAQEQIADGNINIVTEFGNMVSALDAVTAWVVANFPKDGNGFLLGTQFAGDSSGRTTDRVFTPAQTSGLRTALDALIASID